MKQQTFRFGFVCIIMLFMIIANFDVQSTEASPGDAWVKNGMTFTYVLDSFSFGNITEPTTVASDKVSGLDLQVAIGAEYNITVTNDTVRQESDSYYIDVLFDNGTHTVDENNNLKPTNFYFSSVDWDYWINEITYDPVKFFGGNDFDSYSIETSTSEVRINLTVSIEFNSTYTFGMDTSYRYDKTRGIANLVTVQSENYTAIIGTELNMTLRLKGFDPFTPFNTVDTITGSATTNVATGTVTVTTSVETSSDTTVSIIVTDTISTTTDDIITSVETSTSGELTDTNTPTEIPSTSTRALTSETKQSTISRETTTINEETSSETPSVTLPLPVLGPVIVFSGIMVALAIMRKRK